MKRLVLFLAAVTLLIVGASQAKADHIIAATVSWEHAGTNTIKYTPIVYFRTQELINDGGLSANPAVGDIYCEPTNAGGLRFNYGDGNTTPDLCFKILTISPAGWIKTVAVQPGGTTNCLTHTYTSAGCYNAQLFGCCRIQSDGMNNRYSESFVLKTSANTAGTNRSPVEETLTSTFGQLPELVVGQALTSGTAITFQMLASDPDGNPIHWSMASNLDATGNSSANGPSSESGQPAMSISSSGLVTWYNYGVDNTKPWTVQFYACDNVTTCNTNGTCAPIDLLLIMQPTVQETGACVATQGYWKNHTSAWPVSNLTIGGKTYTMSQILGIWGNPPAGDMTVQLFHQLAAAMLNVANGSINTCVQQAITDANAFLVVHPLGSNMHGSTWNNSTGPALLNTLTSYNEGSLCATHRDSPNCGSDGRQIQ